VPEVPLASQTPFNVAFVKFTGNARCSGQALLEKSRIVVNDELETAVRRTLFDLNDAPFPLDYARGNYASALRAKTLCFSDELSAGAIRQVQRHISKFIV